MSIRVFFLFRVFHTVIRNEANQLPAKGPSVVCMYCVLMTNCTASLPYLERDNLMMSLHAYRCLHSPPFVPSCLYVAGVMPTASLQPLTLGAFINSDMSLAKVRKKGKRPEEWACRVCTFQNPAHGIACEMCQTPRRHHQVALPCLQHPQESRRAGQSGG